jgi:hypothetical protein
MTGQRRKESQIVIIRIGQLGKDTGDQNHDRIAGTGQLGQDS